MDLHSSNLFCSRVNCIFTVDRSFDRCITDTSQGDSTVLGAEDTVNKIDNVFIPIEKHTTSKYITLKMLYMLQEEATDRVGVVGDLEALCGEVREGFSDI